MDRADRVHSTPRADSPSHSQSQEERKDRHALAYLEMEEKVCDLERMGEITDRLVGEWVTDVDNLRCKELANFAVQHLHDMLKDFHHRYQNDEWGPRS